jgi:hypothetical protein
MEYIPHPIVVLRAEKFVLEVSDSATSMQAIIKISFCVNQLFTEQWQTRDVIAFLEYVEKNIEAVQPNAANQPKGPRFGASKPVEYEIHRRSTELIAKNTNFNSSLNYLGFFIVKQVDLILQIIHQENQKP